MAKFMFLVQKFNIFTKHVTPRHNFSFQSGEISQQEVAAALRPFYFAVHPDLFWQYPKEKEINENSLKLLNSYLETVSQNLPVRPTFVTFCLRNSLSKSSENAVFRKVNIQLLDKDLRHTVYKILSVCQLPTEYLEKSWKFKTNISRAELHEIKQSYTSDFDSESVENDFLWSQAQEVVRDIEERIRSEPDKDLRIWLRENGVNAYEKLQACQPVRDETEKLCKELKETFGLTDIIWNCGWGITHFRGCLQSFKGLTIQHSEDMKVLKNRTVVFGRQTGVNFEGHIILSSEDVRNNWLEMIRSINQFDLLLQELPASEKALSDVLRGIVVDHRKFQPTVMIQKYIQQLEKLTSALYKYKWCDGYPDMWPHRLENFQIVVECEAGPLMLSPTGQFIVPASCPAFVLVDFISKNMLKANNLRQFYIKMKRKESELYVKCLSEFGLSSLEKDDNVTPDLMVKCCERLLAHSSVFINHLRDLRLRISHYYSVLQDGEMCIPWDWKHF